MVVRSHQVLGRGPAAALWQEPTDGLTEAVLAAADIAAALLSVVDEAAAAGEQLVATLASLGELRFRPPAFTDPVAYGGTVGLH
jgi:hypothetical protein